MSKKNTLTLRNSLSTSRILKQNYFNFSLQKERISIC